LAKTQKLESNSGDFKMKPKIFLSHNKNDKEFIKQLADALRPARIDVWFDDWEIPPGASLRAKIFEEGIPACDLFFVYLTENSINSSWVKQELDAAFVTELENKGGFLALYVDKDDSRDQLPLDLRSRRIPDINADNFSESLLELVALAWETFSKKQVNRVQDNTRIEMLELEKKVLEKELEIEKLKSEKKEDYTAIIQALSEKEFVYQGNTTSLDNFFYSQRFLFTQSMEIGNFNEIMRSRIPNDYSDQEKFIEDILPILVIQNLIQVTGGDVILTELGKKVLIELEKIYGNNIE